jgi:hypothetical protein
VAKGPLPELGADIVKGMICVVCRSKDTVAERMAVGDISKRSWIKVIKDFELAERTSKTVEMATNERHRS